MVPRFLLVKSDSQNRYWISPLTEKIPASEVHTESPPLNSDR